MLGISKKVYYNSQIGLYYHFWIFSIPEWQKFGVLVGQAGTQQD
jgi:hypothetical protein